MFTNIDLEQLQSFIFPLLKQLTGLDIAQYEQDGSVYLLEAGEALEEVAALLILAGSALEDGRLSNEEISNIIAGALTVGDAVKVFTALFNSDPE